VSGIRHLIPLILALVTLISIIGTFHHSLTVSGAEGTIPITILERSGITLSDYSVRIDLTSSNFNYWSSVSSDCSDIYFTDASDNPLYYWVESCNVGNMKATIWVKIPQISANGYAVIYMHHGGTNPYASYRDPNQVFLFYDDFSSLNPNWKVQTIPQWWSSSGPSIYVSNGYLVVTGTDANGRVYWNNGIPYSYGFIMETSFIITSYPWNLGWSSGVSTTNSGVSFGAVSWNVNRWGLFTSVGGSDTGVYISTNVLYNVKLAVTPNKQILIVNEQTLAVRTDSLPLTSPLYLTIWGGGADAYTFNFRFDWIRIRNYVDPEPLVVVGWVPGVRGRFYIPLIITERSGNNLENYSVKVVLNINNFNDWVNIAYPDGSDIYFTDQDDNPLYYWIESFDIINKQAVIWVKVPQVPANGYTVIYMHYGGDNPYSSYRDPNKVFLLFDDFTGTTLDSTKWIAVGDYSISGGIITINPNGVTNTGSVDGIPVSDGIYSVQTFNKPVAVTTKVIAHSDYVRFNIGLLGLYYDYDDGGSNYWGLRLNQQRVYIWGYDVPRNGLVGYVTLAITTTSSILMDPQNNVSFPYGLANNPNNYRVVLMSWANSWTKIDYVIVRSYTNPEPSVLISALPSSGSLMFTVQEHLGRHYDYVNASIVVTTQQVSSIDNIPASLLYFTLNDGTPLRYWICDRSNGQLAVAVEIPDLDPYSAKTIVMHYWKTSPYPSYYMGAGYCGIQSSLIGNATWVQVNNFDKWYAPRYSTSTTITSVTVSSSSISVSSGSSTGTYSVPSFTAYGTLYGAFLSITESGTSTTYSVTARLMNGSTVTVYISTCNSSGPEVTVYRDGLLVSTSELGCGGKNIALIAMVNPSYPVTPSYVVSLSSPITQITITPVTGSNGNSALTMYVYGALFTTPLEVVQSAPAPSGEKVIPITLFNSAGTDYLNETVAIVYITGNFVDWNSMVPSSIYVTDDYGNTLDFYIAGISLVDQKLLLAVKLPYILGYEYHNVYVHYGGTGSHSQSTNLPTPTYAVVSRVGIVTLPSSLPQGWSLVYVATITNTGSSTISNPVVDIVLEPVFDFRLVRVDGADLMVVDQYGRAISFMLVEWNPSVNHGKIRVQLPGSIPAGGSIQVYILAGNFNAQPTATILPSPSSSVSGALHMKKAILPFAYVLSPPDFSSKACFSWSVISPNAGSQAQYRIDIADDPYFTSIIYTTQGTTETSTCASLNVLRTKPYFARIVITTNSGVTSTTWMLKPLFLQGESAFQTPPSNVNVLKSFTIINPVSSPLSMHVARIPIPAGTNPSSIAFIGNAPASSSNPTVVIATLRLSYTYTYSNEALTQGSSTGAKNIVIQGLPPSAYVEIYDLNRYSGRLTYAGFADSSGKLTIESYNIPLPIDGSPRMFAVAIYSGSAEYRTALLPFIVGYGEGGKLYAWVVIPYIPPNGKYTVTMIQNTGQWQFTLDDVFDRDVIYVATWSNPYSHPNTGPELDQMFMDSKVYRLNSWFGAGFTTQIYDSSTSNNNPFGSGDQYMKEYIAVIVPKISGAWGFATDSDDASHVAVTSLADGTRSIVTSWYGSHGVSNGWGRSGSIQLNSGSIYIVTYRQEEVSGGDAARLAVMYPGSSSWSIISTSISQLDVYGIRTPPYDFIVVDNSQDLTPFVSKPASGLSGGFTGVAYNPSQVPAFDVVVPIEIDPKMYGLTSITPSNIHVVGTVFVPSSIVDIVYASLTPGTAYRYSNGAVASSGSAGSNTITISGLPANSLVYLYDGLQRYVLGISDSSGTLTATLYRPVTGALIIVSGNLQNGLLPYAVEADANAVKIYVRFLVLWPGANAFTLYIGNFGSDDAIYGYDKVFQVYINPSTTSVDCLSIPGYGNFNSLTSTLSSSSQRWCRLPYALPNIGNWIVKTTLSYTSTTGTDSVVGTLLAFPQSLSMVGIHSAVATYTVSSSLTLYFNRLNGYNGGDISTLYTLQAGTAVPVSVEVVTGSRYTVNVYITSWLTYPVVSAQYTPSSIGNYVFPAIVVNSGSIAVNGIYIARTAPSVSVSVTSPRVPQMSKPILPILFGDTLAVNVRNPNPYPVYDVVVSITLTSKDIDFSKIHNNGADIRIATLAPVLTQSGLSVVSGVLQPGTKYTAQSGVFVASGSASRSDVAELVVEPYTALFISFHGKLIPIAYDYDGDGVIQLKLNGQFTASFIVAKFTLATQAIPYYIASYVPGDRIVIYVRVPYIPPESPLTLYIYYNSPTLTIDPDIYGVDKVFLFGDTLNYPSGRVVYSQDYGALFPFFTPRNSYAYVESGSYLELYAESLINMPPSRFASIAVPIPLYELAPISDGFSVSTQAYSASISRLLIGFASRYTEIAGAPTGSYGVLVHSGINTIGIYTVADSSMNTISSDIFQMPLKPVITYTLYTSGSALLMIDGVTSLSASSTSLQMTPAGVSVASEVGATWRIYWLGVHKVVGTPVMVETSYVIKDNVVEADLSKWEKVIQLQISNPSSFDLYDYQLRVTIYPSMLSLTSLPGNLASKIRFVATYPVATGEILTTFTASLHPGNKYAYSSGTLTAEGSSGNPYLVKIKTDYRNGIVIGVFKDGKLIAIGRDYDGDGYVELETTATLNNIVAVVVKGVYKSIYLPYWCESATASSATCWVKVPYIPVGDSFNVNIVYSSTGYTPESNIYGPRNVFIFYDDFESGDISSWTVYGGSYGSVTVSSTAYSGTYSLYVKDSSTGGTVSVARKLLVLHPFILSMHVRFDTGANPAYPMNWDGVDVNGNVASASWGSIVSNRMLGYRGAIYYSQNGQYGYTARIYDSTWYTMEVAWDPVNARHMVFLNGVMVGTGADYLDNGARVSYFTTVKITASTAGSTNGIYVDNIVVRKFAYPEPVAITADYATMNTPPYKEASSNILTGNVVPIDIDSSWSDTYYDKAVKIDIPSTIVDISQISSPSNVRFVASYVIPIRTIYISGINLNSGGMYTVSNDKIVKTGSASNGITVTGVSSNRAILVIIPGSYTVLAYDYDGDGTVFIPLSNYRVLNARYTGYIALVEVKLANVVLPYYLAYSDSSRVVYWVRVPYVQGSGTTRILMYYGQQYGTDPDIYGLDKVFAKNLVYVSGYRIPAGTRPVSTSSMDNLYNGLSYSSFIGGAFVEQILHPYNPFSGDDAYATYYFSVIVPKYTGQIYFGIDSDDAADALLYYSGMTSRSVVASYYGGHGPSMSWYATASISLVASTPYVLVYRQEDGGDYQLATLGVGIANNIREFVNFYWSTLLDVYSTPTILQEPMVYVGGRSGYGGIASYIIQWVGNNEYPPFIWFTAQQNVVMRINGNQMTYGAGTYVITLQPGPNKIEVYNNGAWSILAIGNAVYVNATPKFVVTDVYVNGTIVGYLDIGGTPYPVVSGSVVEQGAGTVNVVSFNKVIVKVDVETVNLGISLNTLNGKTASVLVPIVTFGKTGDTYKVIVASSAEFKGFINKLNENLIIFQGVTDIKGYIDVAGLGLNPLTTYVALGDKVYKLLNVWSASTLWIEVK